MLHAADHVFFCKTMKKYASTELRTNGQSTRLGVPLAGLRSSRHNVQVRGRDSPLGSGARAAPAASGASRHTSGPVDTTDMPHIR